jgi:hypothetical protein
MAVICTLVNGWVEESVARGKKLDHDAESRDTHLKRGTETNVRRFADFY